MFAYAVLGLICCILLPQSLAQEEYISPNNTIQCIKDLIEWCDGMKFNQNDTSLSMVSITYRDHNSYHRVFCATDSEGTNCTRNGDPWFSCNNKNEFAYKGTKLSKDSETGADENICKTAEVAFNDLYIQNMSYDENSTLGFDLKTALDKQMESFFKEMAEMREQLEALSQRVFGGMFGGGFPFGGRLPPIDKYPTVKYDDDTENTTPDVEVSTVRDRNQLEREKK